ncbi:putative isomerase YbhE [Vararia minispora EC-137]|uniref:Isomerase YbhE n=1 Tax=Vararia minispora EC-137 TaxID=1314806 RepID=A0ACB8QCX9_9AGAM|nr:putative isomerase YbhE [Vararia minispora EC-137]
MVNFTILAGGYNPFIAAYLFNTDARSLTYTGQTATNANPSWITPHLINSSILYATNENSPGGVQSFVVGPSGALMPFATAPSDGDAPAFASMLSTGQIAAMNYIMPHPRLTDSPQYNTGNGAFITLDSGDPLHFGANHDITFPIREQGNVSHPHMAFEHNGELFVPDLGQDTIWRLGHDASGAWSIHGDIPQPVGSGPRHMTIFKNTLYIAHELASTLTAQPLPAAPNGTSTIIAQLSTIPPNNLTSPFWAAAEILIPTPNARFQTAYAYVSNRNTGTTVDPRGDTVAIFALVPRLRLLAQVYTGVQQVRGMQFGGEHDEFLVLSGVVGDAGVAVFERVDGGADMRLVARDTTVGNRTSFLWGQW